MMTKAPKIEFPAPPDPDYVIINGVRYVRESITSREHREAYEPGGKFYHLPQLSPNDPMNR